MMSRRGFLKGIVLIAGGIAGGTLLEMVYITPKPDKPTSTPTRTLEDNVTITPKVDATLENKLFEFVFPDAKSEQYEAASKNALEDYRTVLNVYGINEKDARVKISIYLETYPNGSSAQRYSISFSYNSKSGSAGGISIDDFTTDRRGLRHEMSHAINHTLFPTKNNIEPWYNTFDEGSAMYASGEVENSKLGGMDSKKDDGSWETIVGFEAIMNRLISNPNQFWERKASIGNNPPGHLTGLYLFWSLEHEGLTPEKHTVALQKLAGYYKEPGTKTNKEMIQSAYEFSLGKNLNYLFNDWLQPGVNRFYPTATPTPTPR